MNVSRTQKIVSVTIVALLAVSLVAFASEYRKGSPQAQVLNYAPVTQETLAWATSLNHNNSLLYQSDRATPCTPNDVAIPSYPYSTSAGICAKADIRITHQEQYAADVNMLRAGNNASCLVDCKGVTYTQDPTAIMTNDGHDFLFNCKGFGASSVITCTAADVATYMELSTATSLVVTDATCPATTFTSGGMADTTGTFTAGTAGSGTVTSTLYHLWTAGETDNSIASLCINTEVHSGSHFYSVYEFSFGPDSLVSGNTLAITASLTAT